MTPEGEAEQSLNWLTAQCLQQPGAGQGTARGEPGHSQEPPVGLPCGGTGILNNPAVPSTLLQHQMDYSNLLIVAFNKCSTESNTAILYL